MNQESQEKINQDWHNQINKEKQEAKTKEETYHEPTFSLFLSSVGMQAMIAMGKLENPITKETNTDLGQARFLIDTLGIIQDKTKGNLTPEEDKALNDYLYNLRIMYIEAKK
mgnify:CR=1 FL=1